jgi:hypothetical protein
MWWWRTVRRAVIPEQIRDEFERYGENIIALVHALPWTPGVLTPQTPLNLTLHDLVYHYRTDAIAWVTERRDKAERREQRLETSNGQFLIFVISRVVTDLALLFK